MSSPASTEGASDTPPCCLSPPRPVGRRQGASSSLLCCPQERLPLQPSHSPSVFGEYRIYCPCPFTAYSSPGGVSPAQVAFPPPNLRLLGLCSWLVSLPSTARGAGAPRTRRWAKAGPALGASPCAVGWTAQVRSWRLHKGPPQGAGWKLPRQSGSSFRVVPGTALASCARGTSSSCSKPLEAQQQTSQSSSHCVRSWPLCISISSDLTDPSVGYVSVILVLVFPEWPVCPVWVFC